MQTLEVDSITAFNALTSSFVDVQVLERSTVEICCLLSCVPKPNSLLLNFLRVTSNIKKHPTVTLIKICAKVGFAKL